MCQQKLPTTAATQPPSKVRQHSLKIFWPTISNKPALEAVAAAEATLKELNIAKTASICLKQVVAEMAGCN